MGSDDPLLTTACGAVLAITMLLLWREGEPPILLLPAATQLAQVLTPRLYANWLGVSLQEFSMYIGDTTVATWLAISAMISLVIGMWCGQKGLRASVVM